MKMRSFAVLAISCLLAANVAPAMADDMNNNSGSSMPSDNGMQNQNGSSDNSNNANNMGNVGSTDEGSPDTATGDDDY